MSAWSVPDGLAEAMEWTETCNEGVTVQGMYEPCEAVAIAMRIDPEEHTPYPVCGRHACGEMVPLIYIVRAAKETNHA